jgi:hypothetical protein
MQPFGSRLAWLQVTVEYMSQKEERAVIGAAQAGDVILPAKSIPAVTFAEQSDDCVMDHFGDVTRRNKIRLDSAALALEDSSRRLMDSVLFGSEDTIESAYAALRFAKLRFACELAIHRGNRVKSSLSRAIDLPQDSLEEFGGVSKSPMTNGVNECC